jgi:hypothetical protein
MNNGGTLGRSGRAVLDARGWVSRPLLGKVLVQGAGANRRNLGFANFAAEYEAATNGHENRAALVPLGALDINRRA